MTLARSSGGISSPVSFARSRALTLHFNGSTRALSDAEAKTFWRGCGAIDAANLSSLPFGKMFQLLLLTGRRRGEVSGMKRSEISGSVWTIPAERTKSGRELRVHVTKTMRAILNSIPRIEGCDHVFGVSGASGSFGYSKATARLDEVTKISRPWCPHDLRRTARTGFGKLGVTKESRRALVEPCAGRVGRDLRSTQVRGRDGRRMAALGAPRLEGRALKCAATLRMLAKMLDRILKRVSLREHPEPRL
jgi:hypothetical protein